MSLRSRLAIMAAVSVAVAVVAVSVVAYFAARRELVGEVDASLADRIRQVEPTEAGSSFMREPGERRAFRGGPAVGLVSRSDFDQLYGQLVTPDGTAIAPADSEISLPVELTDLAVARGEMREPVFRDVTVDDVHLRMVTARVGTIGAVQLARPLSEVDATLSGLAAVLAFVGFGGVGLAAGLGTLVARGALRPVERLTAAAEHVAETQELASRIAVDRQDEIGRLAVSFNAMLTALEESRVQQRRLVHDAGHELRTPLTALRTNIEVLARRGELTTEQRSELLRDVTTELDELGLLVSELVELAADARAADEPVISVDLGRLVGRVVDRARRRTRRSIVVTGSAVESDVRVGQLERAVANLLENAHKWSPEGAPIEVRLDGLRVAVIDHGAGIDPEDRDLVFDRFYRATSARSMPGSGLGLAIVRQIVQSHGGEVFVAETPGGGATVGFELPSGPGPTDAANSPTS